MPEDPSHQKRKAEFDTSPAAMGIDVKSWFFGIGINKYTHFTPLHNAVKDVQDLVRLLQEEYDLTADHTLTLYDEQATRRNIIKMLDRLQREVGAADKLILYYSGHGHLNKDTKKGYWIPTDAERDNTSAYIRNSTIREYIETLKPLHTLLISDSCFSGSLFVRGANRSTASVNELATIPSRWAICSGRHDEEVFDGEPGTNSPFAESIMDTLRRNQKKEINVSRLVDRVIEQTRSNYKQLPEGNPLYGVGHKGGQYIFNRRAVEADDWVTAAAANTLPGYRQFLENHPAGQHADEAREKIAYLAEEAAWAKACAEHSVLSYYEYDQAYPDGRHSRAALDAITELEEESAWQKAQRRDMLSEYRKYTVNYPQGKHRKEANARIAAIISTKQEPALWERTTRSDTPEAYTAYLEKYPGGIYVAEAENRRRELTQTAAEAQEKAREEKAAEERQRQEAAAWESAQSTATEAGYRQFLFSYPQSRFAAAAKTALAQLQRKKAAPTPRPQPAFTAVPATSAAPRPSAAPAAADKKLPKWLPMAGGGLVVLLLLIFGISKLSGSSAPDETAIGPSLEIFTQNSKLGYRNMAGEIQIAAQYDAAEPFENGTARVTQNGLTFLIDESGNCLNNCPEEREDLAWKQAREENTPASYEAYLQSYPAGRYVNQAQQELSSLRKLASRNKSTDKRDPTPPSPTPEPEKPREEIEKPTTTTTTSTPPPPPPVSTSEEVFKVVEQMPMFPGCENQATYSAQRSCADKKMLDYLYRHIEYPAIARENGVEGMAVIGFVVEKNGSLSNFKILRDPRAGCGAEALRVIKLMGQEKRWLPGRDERGQLVRVQFNLPVRFSLE